MTQQMKPWHVPRYAFATHAEKQSATPMQDVTRTREKAAGRLSRKTRELEMQKLTSLEESIPNNHLMQLPAKQRAQQHAQRRLAQPR